MNRICLNGEWKLYYVQNASKINTPKELKENHVPWMMGRVPGNVELDLIQEGKLPEQLYYACNISKVQEYELYDWWYEKEFEVPMNLKGQRLELVFYGVDCIATYWLNGHKIGSSHNMFIKHSFEITKCVRYGEKNTLLVRIESPIAYVLNKNYEPSVFTFSNNYESLWIRKAPHSYGWDIMPRALSAGLWKDVELVVHKKNEIEDLYFFTPWIYKKKAVLGIYYQLNIEADKLKNFQIRIFGGCKDSSIDTIKKVYFKAGMLYIDINNPYLWWPKGYGNPNLYEIVVELIDQGKIIDQRKFNVGIRTVQLIHTPITNGTEEGKFLLKINGIPILCKGTNWVPADVFHSRDSQRYEKILAFVDDLSCNMLRCWGGNVYEEHDFFTFCDQKGIMVWQDFAMACGAYPQDKVFLDTIRKEVESVVKRLRNHPSLIMWCGDNECDVVRYKNRQNPNDNMITREIIPKVIARMDPHRPYIPSSPYISAAKSDGVDLLKLPESHLWGPRDFYKSDYYVHNDVRFISEIGYMGCPSVSSICKFIDQHHLWPWKNNKQWILHATSSENSDGSYEYRIKLMADQIKELFGVEPNHLEDFVIMSQISQAEAYKFFIEMIRLKKWRKTGILWWNIMDGWPQFSDAVVDYYGCKKLSYHYIRRVQQPVCIMVDEPNGWEATVKVGNDSIDTQSGFYRIWDADTDEVLLEGNFTTQVNENSELGKIRVSHGEQRLFLIEWQIGDKKYGNHYLQGHPPFKYEKYMIWLKHISELSEPFNYKNIGK